MAVADELSRIGFAISGTPPSIDVHVGQDTVAMRVTEIAEVQGGVHLRGEIPVSVPPSMPDLSGATISASGDTTLALSGATLVGTRRLVGPSLGALYDAIYELAKTLLAAARLLQERTEAEAQLPPPTEPTPAVATVPYPTPAPTPAPAPPPPAPAAAPPPPPAAAPAPPPPAAAAAGPAITAPMPGAAPTPVAPRPTGGGFAPTHLVPAGGLPAWAAPDASQPPAATLDPGLAVQLAEVQGGWGRIICENTWSAWVDASKLLPR